MISLRQQLSSLRCLNILQKFPVPLLALLPLGRLSGEQALQHLVRVVLRQHRMPQSKHKLRPQREMLHHPQAMHLSHALAQCNPKLSTTDVRSD